MLFYRSFSFSFIDLFYYCTVTYINCQVVMENTDFLWNDTFLVHFCYTIIFCIHWRNNINKDQLWLPYFYFFLFFSLSFGYYDFCIFVNGLIVNIFCSFKVVIMARMFIFGFHWQFCISCIYILLFIYFLLAINFGYHSHLSS